MNKPTRGEVLTLADTVALCGATRLAEVLRRSVKLEAENERLVKENDSLQTEIHRLQEEVELWKSRCEDNT